MPLSLSSQQAIGGRWTEGKQEVSRLGIQAEFTTSLQYNYQFWKVGHEPFATNAIGGTLAGDQSPLNEWGVVSRAVSASARLHGLLRMIE
jgi:hypothetical protein